LGGGFLAADGGGVHGVALCRARLPAGEAPIILSAAPSIKAGKIDAGFWRCPRLATRWTPVDRKPNPPDRNLAILLSSDQNARATLCPCNLVIARSSSQAGAGSPRLAARQSHNHASQYQAYGPPPRSRAGSRHPPPKVLDRRWGDWARRSSWPHHGARPGAVHVRDPLGVGAQNIAKRSRARQKRFCQGLVSRRGITRNSTSSSHSSSDSACAPPPSKRAQAGAIIVDMRFGFTAKGVAKQGDGEGLGCAACRLFPRHRL
jgi:hypothetical protein